jgi:hypothetical protein
MLPQVDEMRPIHNLESITGLVAALAYGGSGSADPKFWLRKVA